MHKSVFIVDWRTLTVHVRGSPNIYLIWFHCLTLNLSLNSSWTSSFNETTVNHNLYTFSVASQTVSKQETAKFLKVHEHFLIVVSIIKRILTENKLPVKGFGLVCKLLIEIYSLSLSTEWLFLNFSQMWLGFGTVAFCGSCGWIRDSGARLWTNNFHWVNGQDIIIVIHKMLYIPFFSYFPETEACQPCR